MLHSVTDSTFPEFQNIVGRGIVVSTLQAIDNYVEGLTGTRFDQELRGNVVAVLLDLANDYSTWLETTARVSMAKATDSQLRAAERISELIADSMRHDVISQLRVPITQEVYRVLRDLTNALPSIFDRGYRPGDLFKTKKPQAD
jgi:hypothetical protein